MIISSVNYRETFFLNPDLTRILGIPTYDALHQMQLKLNNNALSVYSKLGGGTHIHLSLLMTNKKYTPLSPVAYVCTVHPGIIQTPINTTRVTSYKLKRVYDKNLQVFHEVRGAEQALILQVVTNVIK